jgi:hypothetical protein
MKERIVFFLLITNVLFFSSCFIEEEFSDSERIVGKWSGANKEAFLEDGDSFGFTAPCESSTEFIFYDDGRLGYQDLKEKEINDGSIDFCEINELTGEEGTWEILSSGKYRFTLQNTATGEDIFIEPYSVNLVNDDELHIRYNEFANEEDETISYFVYTYFRRFN